jgi:hypothetical protein
MGVRLINLEEGDRLTSVARIEEDKEQRIIERFGEAFELADRAELGFEVQLSADSASDLVAMGPSHWHRAEGVDVAAEPLSTTASFVILRLRRR